MNIMQHLMVIAYMLSTIDDSPQFVGSKLCDSNMGLPL